MSDIDKILAPKEGDNPCGDDLEYDDRFQSLKALLETSDEENPSKWKTVKKQSMELLVESCNIEFLVLYAVSMVATEGYQGLRDGLHVFSKSIEDFWENIYPELDDEEPEPDCYVMRLNLISQIGEKPGKMGDNLGFVEKVLRTPLSVSNPRISVTFWPVWESEQMELEDTADADAAKAYIGQMAPEEKKQIAGLANESIELLQKLSNFLMEKTAQAYNGPFDECLIPTLKQISKAFVLGEGEVIAAEAVEGAGAAAGQPAGGAVAMSAAPPPPPPGTVNSREDVKKSLEKIIDYYKKNEPSSPIPYLAERTKELVDANFIEVVKNLSKESEAQFKKILNI